ncbi:mediator of RNA polymerase II transcription subunit 7 [Plectosphaerella cucumerina]|uniref:Mediator of RNA polymerase II transcription subunit 7 n=1 Tax=Plectosphaerella cucumerina TaxID=40658 RepID=A0A8K0WXI9_9PEZI|nr:mediator of RNA polymerase II transcription subunit 7 [Plectosphaerella cucumerina]
MADPNEQLSQKAIASQFPNPPPFWKQFSADNIARLDQIRTEQALKSGTTISGLPVRTLGVPDDLVNLQPPAEPVQGTWRVLGGAYSLDDKLPSLEETTIKRLAPAYSDEREVKHLDRAFELKRMAKSLLLNFLELIGIMGIAPEDASSKTDDLRTLLMNFHHALNEYRPHQARESAIALMQSHLDRTRAETAAIRTQVDRAKRVLEGLGSLEVLAAQTDGVPPEDDRKAHAEQTRYTRELEAWASTDVLFG